MHSTKARTWYNPSLYFLLPLLLLPTPQATARGTIFSERAYVNVGFGEFQCERFREAKGAHIKKDIKASHVFNLGVGYRLSGHIRSEINFHHTKLFYKASDSNSNLGQKITVISSMANLHYDLYEETLINPYVTAGIGISRTHPRDLIDMKTDTHLRGRSKTNLAWNFGCGILLNTMSRDYEINIGYRYIDYGIIQTSTFSKPIVYVNQRIRGHLGIISVLFKL
jgi:opacity protein-like surface antigen